MWLIKLFFFSTDYVFLVEDERCRISKIVVRKGEYYVNPLHTTEYYLLRESEVRWSSTRKEKYN